MSADAFGHRPKGSIHVALTIEDPAVDEPQRYEFQLGIPAGFPEGHSAPILAIQAAALSVANKAGAVILQHWPTEDYTGLRFSDPLKFDTAEPEPLAEEDCA